MSKERIGFIGGCGHHYLRGLLDLPGAREQWDIAVASDTYAPGDAKQLAKTLEAMKWFDDPVEMLDFFKPDYVSVGAMYGYAGETIIPVLERGIPTVSDKPVAATWKQYERIRMLSEDTQAILLTEFDSRSSPEFRAARRAVERDLIGEVVLATAQKSYCFGRRPDWYSIRESYGGTILWVAGHGIDAIRYVTGRRFTSVRGQTGNVSRKDYGTFEDHTVSLFELDNGGSGIVHADYLRPSKAVSHGDDRLRVAGTTGIVEVIDQKCILITEENESEDITGNVAAEPMCEMLLKVLRGNPIAEFSTEVSLELAAVMLAARDAADTGRFIRLDSMTGLPLDRKI